MLHNDLVVDVSLESNDKLKLKITKQNSSSTKPTILIDQTIKLQNNSFVPTNISPSNQTLIKSTADHKELLIKCSAGNGIDDIAMHVDTAGNVTLKQVHSLDNSLLIINKGNITISHADFHCNNLALTANKITNYGILDVKKTLTLNANQGTTNTPSGKIRVYEKIDNRGTLTNQGLIYGKNLVVDMHGSNLLNTVQKNQTVISSISAENNLSIVNAKEVDNQAYIKTLKENSNLILEANKIENNNSIFSRGNAELMAASIHNTDKAKGVIAEKKLIISAEEIINDRFVSGGDCKMLADNLINNHTIKFKEQAELIVGEELRNNHIIQQAKNSRATLKLNVNKLTNDNAIIANKITGDVKRLKNNNKIYSNDDLSLGIDLLENNKNIHSGNTLKLDITNQDSNNFGLIEAENKVNLQIAKNFQNYKLIRSPKADVFLSSQDLIENHGQIHAANTCSLTAKKLVKNTGFIAGKKTCSITGDTIENDKIITSRRKTKVTTDKLCNAGKILTKGVTADENIHCDLEINANELINQDQGLIY